MKYLFPVLLLFVVTLTSAEKLKIIDINHGVVNVNGKKLQKGSVFESKGKIVWSDDQQIMKVVGMESHKFNVYAAQTFKVGKISTIEELLFQKQNLSSRDGVLINAQDFVRFFNRDIALMHSFSVETGYTFDDSHFLFLQFDYQNETINKRLTCTMHSVQFNDSIFRIDGQPFEPTTLSARLYYHDATSGLVTLLADKFVIHVTPRAACASFLANCDTDMLTLEEKAELITDYCHIKYPDITFLRPDISAFVLHNK
jgi:hypothetical protein